MVDLKDDRKLNTAKDQAIGNICSGMTAIIGSKEIRWGSQAHPNLRILDRLPGPQRRGVLREVHVAGNPVALVKFRGIHNDHASAIPAYHYPGMDERRR